MRIEISIKDARVKPYGGLRERQVRMPGAPEH